MKSKGKMLALVTGGLALFLIPVTGKRKGGTVSNFVFQGYRPGYYSKDLADTVPEARSHFEALIAKAKELGMRPWIASTLRPCTTTKPGSAVKGCRSWHAFGRAIDVQLQSKAGQIDDRTPYEQLGEWWEARGGIWGGNFGGYPNGVPGYEKAGPGDVLHFQWTGSHRVVPDELCSHDDCEGSITRYLEAQYREGEGATVVV